MICRHRIERAAHAASALIRCCFPYRLMLNIFVTKRASPCISSDALHTLDRDPIAKGPSRPSPSKSLDLSMRSSSPGSSSSSFFFCFLCSLLLSHRISTNDQSRHSSGGCSFTLFIGQERGTSTGKPAGPVEASPHTTRLHSLSKLSDDHISRTHVDY